MGVHRTGQDARDLNGLYVKTDHIIKIKLSTSTGKGKSTKVPKGTNSVPFVSLTAPNEPSQAGINHSPFQRPYLRNALADFCDYNIFGRFCEKSAWLDVLSDGGSETVMFQNNIFDNSRRLVI